MSWARDEWKLDLPTTALKKISELENDAENLRKNKQQQQFQLENVSNALQKQKQLTADEKTINANLRREIQELTRKCDDLESQSENKEVDLRVRDNKITLLEDQLQKVRARLKEEGENNSELIKKLDEQQAIAEGKENEIKEMKKELERTKDAKDKIERELDGKPHFRCWFIKHDFIKNCPFQNKVRSQICLGIKYFFSVAALY